ncbi:MAG: SCO family protein [Acidimicrobiales bacterium]
MSNPVIPDDPSSKLQARVRTPRALYVALVVLVLAAATFAFYAVRLRDSQQAVPTLRASGVPQNVSTHTADLMALSPVPARPAPNFTLTDQNGHTMSLRSFRGKAVVLEFMDPHCTDICPIVSQEFIDANHNLGRDASKVVFLAVNVNKYHASVADVSKFTTEHRLNTIKSWHFFTGKVSELPPIWRAYGVQVEAPNPNADIVHTSVIFFIDPSGRERYLAEPVVDHTSKGTAFLPATSLVAWGKGISQLAKDLIK